MPDTSTAEARERAWMWCLDHGYKVSIGPETELGDWVALVQYGRHWEVIRGRTPAEVIIMAVEFVAVSLARRRGNNPGEHRP